MTWKLSVAFYKLRQLIGRATKWRKKPDKTGEFLLIAKIDEVDFEGKAPTDIKIYFDESLDPRQCQQIATETAGAFLAVTKQKQKENATKEENRQEPKPQEAVGGAQKTKTTQTTKTTKKKKPAPVALKKPVRQKSTKTLKARKAKKHARQNRKTQMRQGKGRGR